MTIPETAASRWAATAGFPFPPGSHAGKAPPGVLADDSAHFDWQGANHRLWHQADTVIYELHVGGFTSNLHPGIKDAERGEPL